MFRGCQEGIARFSRAFSKVSFCGENFLIWLANFFILFLILIFFFFFFRGVTHKNNVVRYCKQKIKDADSNPNLFDKDSYKLIWELLILMIRQNGVSF